MKCARRRRCTARCVLERQDPWPLWIVPWMVVSELVCLLVLDTSGARRTRMRWGTFDEVRQAAEEHLTVRVARFIFLLMPFRCCAVLFQSPGVGYLGNKCAGAHAVKNDQQVLQAAKTHRKVRSRTSMK